MPSPISASESHINQRQNHLDLQPVSVHFRSFCMKLQLYTFSLDFDINFRKVPVTVLSLSISKVSSSFRLPPPSICSTHQPILVKVKTASSLLFDLCCRTHHLNPLPPSVFLCAPKACTWVSLELSFTHNTNFKDTKASRSTAQTGGFWLWACRLDLISLCGVLWVANRSKGCSSFCFFTPSGSRDIRHHLPLGARSCQSHAGRVSAAWRGGMLYFFALLRNECAHLGRKTRLTKVPRKGHIVVVFLHRNEKKSYISGFLQNLTLISQISQFIFQVLRHGSLGLILSGSIRVTLKTRLYADDSVISNQETPLLKFIL